VQDTTGSCRYDAGLVVTTTSEVRCDLGPDTVFPSRQTIDVLARFTGNACAAIYFRISTEGAYRAAVCPDKVTLAVSGDHTVTTLASATYPSATGIEAHGITVFADGAQAVISLDQSEVLRTPLTQASLVSGKVTFGALARDNARAEVHFSQAVLRAGGPKLIPLPGFLHGDATFDAHIPYINPSTHVAVVEQADLVTGSEFCRRHRVDAGSDRCSASAVLDSRGLSVTLPLSRSLRVREFRSGSASCVDAATRVGRCESTSARFRDWATQNSPAPARVVIRSGTVIEVDELDLPN
jgi:eukaryotic-like serine/threonine-protein kinase